MLKIITNPDKEFVVQVRKRLEENDGYCPCALVRKPDTKCLCKNFRDMFLDGKTGTCECGLYTIVENQNELKEN